jgi:hypothetical protein
MRLPAAAALCALAAAPAAAWYNPLDELRTDGQPMSLLIATPYLPIGGGDCSIYPYTYYDATCSHPAYDIGSANGGWWINGQPVHAAEAGTVIAIDPDQYCGQDVFVDHGNGYVTRYCHLSAFGAIWVGKAVAAREVVGYVGMTGADVPHLHFEMHAGSSIYSPYVDSGYSVDWPREVTGAPADPCAGLDYAGRCNSGSVEWCEGGALHSKDCAARGQVCGWQDDQVGYNCLAPAPAASTAPTCDELGYAGRCDGALLWWCDGGAVQSYDCGAIGWSCGWDGANGYNCLRPFSPSGLGDGDGKAPRATGDGPTTLAGGCGLGAGRPDPLHALLLLCCAGALVLVLRRRM